MADFGISTALALAGTVLSAATTIAGGAAANRQAKAQARRLEQHAQQEQAAANREAQKRRAETELLLSRQQAVAAASGAGASDPTIVELMSDAAAEGEVRAEEAQYVGELRADDMRTQAATRRAEGQAAKTASMFNAGRTLIGSAASMYQKYNLEPVGRRGARWPHENPRQRYGSFG
ncbi:MAG TPA: hypothetical protein VJ890_14520 [Vineibacter sp.]|nr:hypothetical protein [Vineibacter sp.]